MTKLQKLKDVIITERGFAGHFIGSSSCKFRRNTLLEYGNKKIVVSTVGDYQIHLPDGWKKTKYDNEIGCERTYETMAFKAIYQEPYWEADVEKQINFKSKWAIGKLERETDKEADEMHEKVVKELSKTIKE